MELLTTSLQKYLLTIYELHLTNKTVHQIDVALKLGYSKASVSRAIHLLKEKGYLIIQQKQLILTNHGEKEVQQFYTNYQLFYQMLLKHEFTQQEAQYYSLKVIEAVDNQFLQKINTYHQKNHIYNDLPSHGK